MHALPFSAQRSRTSTSLCTLENPRRGGDRCKGLTEKSMFFLSWLTARGSGMGSACLITDTDSPAKTRGKRWTSHVPSPASAHPCYKPAPHAPQPSRAAPNYPNIHHGDVKPHMSHRKAPGFVFCRKDTQAPGTSHLGRDFEDWRRSKHNLNLAFTPFPTPAKCLSQHQLQNLPPGRKLPLLHEASPVRMDWSTRRVVERISMIRMSAGTLSPTARTRAEQVALAAPNTPGMGITNPELRPTMWRCTAAPSLEQ